MAYHTGVHNIQAAKTVEEIMNALYYNKRDYAYIKENYKRLANAIAKQAHYDNLTTDPEKTAKVMEKAFEKTFKIIDKLLPEVNEENLEVLGRAIHMSTDDPFVVLRNAGIDIEPELEEFRQFLAEISGKKIEAKKPKSPETKKAVEDVKSSSLSQARLEVLSILNGLEFAGFTEDAKRRAIERLSMKVEELLKADPTPENLQALGLYTFALEAIRREKLERLGKL